MTLADLHVALGLPVILANAAVALWAFAAHWLKPLQVRALWWAVAAAQVSIFVQATLGAVGLTDGADRPGIHFFYGFLAITGVALLYAWRSNEALAQWRYLVYGLGGAFVTGLLIRAHTLPVVAAAAASFVGEPLAVSL